MPKIKSTKKYYFTVEGETENWYLKWLQDKINSVPKSNFRVSFDCPVQKNPLKRVKSLSIPSGKIAITHIFDYESNEEIHVKQFVETLDLMKKAESLGKHVKYNLGYSNFTFELWIILHKCDCNSSLNHRDQYLTLLNKAYAENFEDLKAYKHESNFKRVLSKINIDDVSKAIERSKKIMKNQSDNGYILHKYKSYTYYKENPSLSIWEAIEKILIDCGIINKKK